MKTTLTMQYIDRINKVSNQFKEVFSPLSYEQLNFKPSANIWSIAQNLDHLIKINESYFPTFNSIMNHTYKKPFMGNFTFLVQYFGTYILKSVGADRKKKISTFPVWEPMQSEINDALNRFLLSQENLKEYIENCSEFLGRNISISSPANSSIVYTIDTAIEIIITHQERHFIQANELLLVS